MRILAMVQGQYGKRIVENIRKRAPSDWTVEAIQAPRALPLIVDDAEEFLPRHIPQADLLLALVESPQVAQLIPAIARLSKTKAAIVPIDNSAWVPQGLRRQLQCELAEMGVDSVFPKTFCTLTEDTFGYRGSAEPYSNAIIAAFARHFGRPRLRVTVNPATRKIEAVVVERGAPCGSTHFTAERLVGLSVDEVLPRAGLICHHYPCLASMERERIDDRLPDETLMHVSGYVINEELEEQVKPFRKPPTYVTPGERVDTADK